MYRKNGRVTDTRNKEPEHDQASGERPCPDFIHLNLEEGFEWPAPQPKDANCDEEDTD